MNSKSIRNLTLSAMFAALTFLATFYLKLPIPLSNGGYVHLGDSMIFLAASLIPSPYAAAAGAIGASLADISSPGGAVWAPYTLVIKALMALVFTHKTDRILTKRNILMSFVAGVICVAGYFLAEAIIAGSFMVPLARLVTGIDLFQFLGSIILYIIIGYALDRAKIKKLM